MGKRGPETGVARRSRGCGGVVNVGVDGVTGVDVSIIGRQRGGAGVDAGRSIRKEAESKPEEPDAVRVDAGVQPEVRDGAEKSMLAPPSHGGTELESTLAQPEAATWGDLVDAGTPPAAKPALWRSQR